MYPLKIGFALEVREELFFVAYSDNGPVFLESAVPGLDFLLWVWDPFYATVLTKNSC